MFVDRKLGPILAGFGLTGIILASPPSEVVSSSNQLKVDASCRQHSLVISDPNSPLARTTRPFWHVDWEVDAKIPPGTQATLRISSGLNPNDLYEMTLFAPLKTPNFQRVVHVMGNLDPSQPVPPRFRLDHPYSFELITEQETIRAQGYTPRSCFGPEAGSIHG